MEPISIGPRLRTLREQHGLTLTTLAERLSLPSSTLSRMERSQRSIPADLLPPWLAAVGADDEDALELLRVRAA